MLLLGVVYTAKPKCLKIIIDNVKWNVYLQRVNQNDRVQQKKEMGPALMCITKKQKASICF